MCMYEQIPLVPVQPAATLIDVIKKVDFAVAQFLLYDLIVHLI